MTISLFIQLLFSDFDSKDGRFEDNTQLYNIAFSVLCLILIPLCLIKNFQKI